VEKAKVGMQLSSFPQDPSQNVIPTMPHPLDAFFLPKSIAVIGAKDDVGSVGRTLLSNLLSTSFTGTVFPVNPKRSEVLGVTCYKTVKDLPVVPDLAIIVTPAPTVPGLIDECAQKGVKAAIIISAGFKERGQEGTNLEEAIIQKKQNMRIIGPNCLGHMNPHAQLNASFAKEGMAIPGSIAFISQSGAMCTAVLDWSFSEKIGFSAFVSVGSMIDVDWADLIRYFGSDPNTTSILLYMETVGDARAFLSAAKEIALEKPIIVIKPGRSQEAAKAAASHTGSLTGSDEVFDAALERVGVLRVDSIAQLFHMTEVLAKQPLPKGNRLHIITNAGGPAVLATDAAVLAGARVLPLQQETAKDLDTFLPHAWSRSNPIDILGDASPTLYEKTLDHVLKAQDSDGVLVILSPQDMTDPIGTAEVVASAALKTKKPVLASWMGGAFVQGGIELLNKGKIPTFAYPDDAAWSFAVMWRYSQMLKSLYETPMMNKETDIDRDAARRLLEQVQSEEREILSEFESKKLLGYYGIPTVQTLLAKDENEATMCAKTIGFPVVLKLYSHTITHKTDVGGVKLRLGSEEAVRNAFFEIKAKVPAKDFLGVTVQPMVQTSGIELIIGSLSDPQFGPIILFGAGGIMVEIFKDHALGLPPLNDTLAKIMMEKTKIYGALQGFRGQKAVSQELLRKILVSFSIMIASEPLIKECDINPLVAAGENIVALDARVVLHSTKPSTSLAIRPYPVEYISEHTLKNGAKVEIRPICPEDEPAVGDFHKELSEKSVRQRYFEFKSLSERTAHERLIRICSSDFDTNLALIAEKQGLVLGIARIIRLSSKHIGEIKMIIRDDSQGQGLGGILLGSILQVAKKEGIRELHATVLNENKGMLHLLEKEGFSLTDKDPYVHAVKK
jgi:acetyltransferase